MQIKKNFQTIIISTIVFSTNSYAQVIDGFKNSSTPIVKQACQEALVTSNLDDQSFIKTDCGMYMLGYAHGAYAMRNVLIDGIGYNEGSWRVIKNTPYCEPGFMKLSDLAKLFMDEAALHVEYSDTAGVLIKALHKKYPCENYIKNSEKEFQDHGFNPPSNKQDEE